MIAKLIKKKLKDQQSILNNNNIKYGMFSGGKK